MNEIRVIRKAFAASLIISSAELTSHRTSSVSSEAYNTATASAVAPLEPAYDHDDRVHEVVDGVALSEELRVRGVTDMREPARVEPGSHLLPRSNRHGRLHHEHGTPLERGQIVDDRPDAA